MPEPHLLRKRETVLGFALRRGQRVARREQEHVQSVAAIGRPREVAALVGGLERTAHQITASPNMSRLWQDGLSQGQIGQGLEAPQAPMFDQVVAKLAEAHSGLVVAEISASDPAKHGIGEARPVAVATLEAEIDRAADDQGLEGDIRPNGRRKDLGQHIERREGDRVAHQRQLDERLDGAAPELGPDPLVFAGHLLVSRLRRPVDADPSEVVETDGDRAAALTQRRVHIYA
jgi:hypothetical protein